MALDDLAKRIYNVAPDPVRLTFADGRVADFEIESAEFFQDDFQGEATRPGEEGATYRLVTAEEGVVVGRRGPDDDGWSTYGTVVDVERKRT